MNFPPLSPVRPFYPTAAHGNDKYKSRRRSPMALRWRFLPRRTYGPRLRAMKSLKAHLAPEQTLDDRSSEMARTGRVGFIERLG